MILIASCFIEVEALSQMMKVQRASDEPSLKYHRCATLQQCASQKCIVQ